MTGEYICVDIGGVLHTERIGAPSVNPIERIIALFNRRERDLMSLLYEPDQDEGQFRLTPDYDAWLAEWANQYPSQPFGPAFTVAECEGFTFRWPVTRVKKGR